MTTDAVLVLRTVFDVIWTLFTSWYIPGTHVTPAGWAFFVLFAVLVIKILKRLLLDNYNDDSGSVGGSGGSGLIPRL